MQDINVIDYFNPEYYTSAKKERKICLIIYLVIAGVFLAFVAGCMLWYSTLTYKDSLTPLVKAIAYIVSAIFIVFSFIYMGIKFRRTNKYYKLCYNLATGLKETFTAKFLRASENLVTKDGVDCKTLVFEEWNKYKKDFYERVVYVFYEKPLPEIEENTDLEFTTQGNFLLNYKILTNKKETE